MYLKDARGDWMVQPAGMVPSWRGWARGLIGPSTSYRMPPLTKMSGCGACGGMGAEEYQPSESLPDVDTTYPPEMDEPDRDIPMDTSSITAAEREEARVKPAELGGKSSTGTLIAIGVGVVALWLLFGQKARRNAGTRQYSRRREAFLYHPVQTRRARRHRMRSYAGKQRRRAQFRARLTRKQQRYE